MLAALTRLNTFWRHTHNLAVSQSILAPTQNTLALEEEGGRRPKRTLEGVLHSLTHSCTRTRACYSTAEISSLLKMALVYCGRIPNICWRRLYLWKEILFIVSTNLYTLSPLSSRFSLLSLSSKDADAIIKQTYLWRRISNFCYTVFRF